MMKIDSPVQNGFFNISGFRVQRGAVFLLILLGSLFFAVSCKQSPIFFYISQEVKLREPLITGTPTNIVVWNDGVYVANFSSLRRYKKPNDDEEPVWVSIGNRPAGQIRGLAATETYIYLLTSDGLYKATENPSGDLAWTKVGIDPADSDANAYPSIQTIYGNSKRLFAGTYDGDPGLAGTDYAILYDNNGTLTSLKTGVHLLSGASFDGTTHYIATKGSGIFTVDDSASPFTLGDPITDTGTDLIMGIICYNSEGIAVRRSGTIITVTKTGIKARETAIGNYTTGALALWRVSPVPGNVIEPSDPLYPDKTVPQLLLAGIQGSLTSTTQTYTNGYREIRLDETTGALPDSISVSSPGEQGISSVSSREKYTSSLGQYPIQHLFQVPYEIDKTMPIFASTVNQGLWSYRDHGDGDVVWNAE